MPKYQLTLDINQMKAMTKALDFFARIGIAQFEELLRHPAWAFGWISEHDINERKHTEQLLTEVKKAVTGYTANAGNSITKAERNSMIAYELYQVVDYELAKLDGRDINRPPINWSRHPLATIEKIED